MSEQGEMKKNIEVLLRACVISQNKGCLSLKDASLVYMAVKSLTTETKEMEEKDAISACIQASALGQKGGAYTLEDANAVFKAISFLEAESKVDSLVEEPKIKEI